MNQSETAGEFQPPPDSASREEIIGALQYWVLRAKKAERAIAESQPQPRTKPDFAESAEVLLRHLAQATGEPTKQAIAEDALYRMWIGQRVDDYAELGDGEPSPPPDVELCQICGRNNPVWFAPNPVWNAVVREISGILCPICFIERADKQGFRSTGWELIPENSQILTDKSQKVTAYPTLRSGAAQEVSPTCPLCKKSTRFMRQPGTCSHPFHDEPFRKKVEEVSPPSPREFIESRLIPPLLHGDESHQEWLRTELRKWIPDLETYTAALGDTRELKAALRNMIEIINHSRRDLEFLNMKEVVQLQEAERLLG